MHTEERWDVKTQQIREPSEHVLTYAKTSSGTSTEDIPYRQLTCSKTTMKYL